MSTQSIGSCKCFHFIKLSRLFCWHVLTHTKYPFFHIGMNLDNKVTFTKPHGDDVELFSSSPPCSLWKDERLAEMTETLRERKKERWRNIIFPSPGWLSHLFASVFLWCLVHQLLKPNSVGNKYNLSKLSEKAAQNPITLCPLDAQEQSSFPCNEQCAQWQPGKMSCAFIQGQMWGYGVVRGGSVHAGGDVGMQELSPGRLQLLCLACQERSPLWKPFVAKTGRSRGG